MTNEVYTPMRYFQVQFQKRQVKFAVSKQSETGPSTIVIINPSFPGIRLANKESIVHGHRPFP